MKAAEEELAGGDRKWLMVGGSYPGALSAWFRLKHPELADASWSSSGVILAVENFTVKKRVLCSRPVSQPGAWRAFFF